MCLPLLEEASGSGSRSGSGSDMEEKTETETLVRFKSFSVKPEDVSLCD